MALPEAAGRTALVHARLRDAGYVPGPELDTAGNARVGHENVPSFPEGAALHRGLVEITYSAEPFRKTP